MRMSEAVSVKGGLYSTLILPVILATVLSLQFSPSRAQEPLRMQAVFPSGLSLLGGAGTRFTEQVERQTRGRVKITYYEPGELVAALDTLDAVSEGRVDLTFTTAGYYTSDNPELTFFAVVPFGAEGLNQYQWVRSGVGRGLFDDIHTRLGVKALPCMLLTPEGGGWFRQPIRRVGDFNNLKIRFFGYGARVVQRLGAQPVLLAGADIYPALETGDIDATEFSTPDIDLLMGFERIVQNYYYPGWHQRDSLGVVYFNQTVWKQLGARTQAVIEEVCHDNVLYSHTAGKKLDRAALREFRDRGIRPKQFPTPVIAALRKEWNNVASEEASRSRDFRRVWQAWRKFLGKRRSESFRSRTTRRKVQREHPDGLGFYANRGQIAGRLRSAARSSHALTLEKQNTATRKWRRVAQTTTDDATGSIRYTARPGFYRWVVNTQTTSGRYTLKTSFE